MEIQSIIGMYKRGAISIRRAAGLANVTPEGFLQELVARGISLNVGSKPVPQHVAALKRKPRKNSQGTRRKSSPFPKAHDV